MKGVEIIEDQAYFTGSTADLTKALASGALDHCGSLLIEGKLNVAPAELGRLTKLRELVLDTDTLQSIDPGIFDCTALVKLVVLSNQIKFLPTGGWGRLTALEELDLTTSNALRGLPDDLGDATRLGGAFDLTSMSKLTALPASFGRLARVTVLRLPPGVNAPDPIAGMTDLRILELRRGTALPNDIGALQSLENLFVDGSPISAVPASIGDASGLLRLGLSDTQITSLPDSITRLPRLFNLDLANTPLQSLPDEIGAMRLSGLHLRGTAITRLPASLAAPAGDLRLYLPRDQRAAIEASSAEVLAALGARYSFD